MKTDYLGNELEIGDAVAFMQIGYRGLMKGIIVKMGEQKAKIIHEKTTGRNPKTESIQFYNQMVKVNTSDNSNYAVTSTAPLKLPSLGDVIKSLCNTRETYRHRQTDMNEMSLLMDFYNELKKLGNFA